MIPDNYWLYLQILFFLFITPGSPRIVMCSYTMTYGLKKSDDVGLDLVEISPGTNPPVCKILDYGKYRAKGQNMCMLLWKN